MSEEDKRIVEINGVKVEVDLREAKTIDYFKIGSKVKVLKKEFSSWEVHKGVIVGFDQFKSLPTIIVCYLDVNYSETNLRFAYINEESEEIEIVECRDDIDIEKSSVLENIENEKDKLKQKIADLDNKKNYFLKHFNKYFE